MALAHSFSTGGTNIVRGFLNYTEDLMRAVAGRGPAGSEAFKVGGTVAVTH